MNIDVLRSEVGLDSALLCDGWQDEMALGEMTLFIVFSLSFAVKLILISFPTYGGYLTCDRALVTPVLFLSLRAHAPFYVFFF